MIRSAIKAASAPALGFTDFRWTLRKARIAGMQLDNRIGMSTPFTHSRAGVLAQSR